MKQILHTETNQQKAVAHPLLFSALALLLFFAVSCAKEASTTSNSLQDNMLMNKTSMLIPGDMLTNYSGLQATTLWELQQARAATARYRDIKNAVKDGYADIDVVRENMGYHFLKMDNLDATFDFRKPEILVYNKMENGSMQLVAVEYAVPIPLSPNNAPAGFTGNNDVWKYDTDFNLWLLHAWVWYHNPDGVFNPTNPLIHVH
ncbi:MAG: hypothetical protein GXC73_20230 [Chitinophagaceae bacterium]|nr:hypothetical protein [Chitinophagaceae bacterium]